ncbi:hypothetical protein CCHR01_18561 [Colletotrichum chrysophilum]|uniref:Uncharacterized protein n=1 Tax=Colletotrichum chrysophilum TaxID=1836956 RepID=A0AAD9A056_9PEZI|nr:hypothetical protein CCHR01_18561 [Colletotrichum chrysophilum]
MLTDRNHLMYLGDHLGINKGHCSGLTSIALQQSTYEYYLILSAHFHCEYSLNLRLITLASKLSIYDIAYKLQPRPRPQCTVTAYQSPASVSRPYCRIADRNISL